MSGFPVTLELAGQSVLVVGGGPAAETKLRQLIAAGARATVLAPEAGIAIRTWARKGQLVWRARDFRASDAPGNRLIFSATGNPAQDAAVARAAEAAGVLVNVPDVPELCRFTMPAVVNRDPVTVAISTGGASPLLARRVRAQVEAALPARLGRLARFAAEFRGGVRAKVPAGLRHRFWQEVLDGPIAAAVLAGDEPHARERMIAKVNQRHGGVPAGRVAIVGAGPGDPDLLTLRALRLLQDADVIVHDRLVGPEILELARRDAERLFVGKAKGAHSTSQAQIHELLIARARAGQKVVRLKGGDPFIFGRGGEELDALRDAGIEAEIVPGITAASGCAAAAGIPLTLRGEASAVTFVTGHGQAGEPDLDWRALTHAGQTLAIYMGLSNAAEISARLIENGLSPATPAAVIENGTLARQRVLACRLDALGRRLRQAELQGPALLLVGEVARRAEEKGEHGLAPLALAAG